jgi:hypothetical protein
MKAIITNESKEQKALNDFLNEEIDNKIYLKDIHIASGEILQALVDKSNPMKVIRKQVNISTLRVSCGNCDNLLVLDIPRDTVYRDMNYCSKCGQKLRSDSNE